MPAFAHPHKNMGTAAATRAVLADPRRHDSNDQGLPGWPSGLLRLAHRGGFPLRLSPVSSGNVSKRRLPKIWRKSADLLTTFATTRSSKASAGCANTAKSAWAAVPRVLGDPELSRRGTQLRPHARANAKPMRGIMLALSRKCQPC